MPGWWVAGAWAGVPVVTETGGPEVLAAVAARTGLPAEQLQLVRRADVAREVVVLGDGTFRACAGAVVDEAKLEADLTRARAALAAAAPDVDAQLDRLVVALGCAGRVVPTRVGAAAFRLRADRRAATGQDAAAELVTAEGFEVAGEGPLAVRPVTGASSGPWLDGRPVPAEGCGARPGLHLLQYARGGEVRSGWLTVGGDVRLVFPATLPPSLGALSDPARRPVAEALVAAIVEGPSAYVAESGGLWLVQLGDPAATTELTPPAAPPPAPAGPPPRPRRP